MKAVAGFILACLMILVVLAVALRIIAACHRFVCVLRGDPVSADVHIGSPPAPRAGVISYRTRNGRSDYRFRIEEIGGNGYRVYILDHPSYGSRDTSAHATHRHSDSRGHYICWNGTLNSVEEARKVAAAWADQTEVYILRGMRF